MYSLPFTISPSTETILILIALAAITLLIVSMLMMEMRLRRFMRGGNKSLEGTLTQIMADHKESEEFQKDIVRALGNIDGRLKTSPRGVGVVRFDAFEGDGSGGKQSFAIAFVSESGDGVVISSLHARASTRIFAKPVAGFTSQNELTEEEKEAISTARSHIRK